MKLRRFRRGTWQAGAPLALGQDVSIRRVTALLVTVILAFLFLPVGALANVVPKVFIADPLNNDNIAHVDGAGNLQVSGNLNVANTPTVKAQQDGTWNVGLTGTPTVHVGNFPSTQDVNVVGGTLSATTPVATDFAFASFTVAAGGIDSKAIDPIDATLITVVGGGDDEVTIEFDSCCGSPIQTDFELGDQDENLGPFVSIPLSQPVHVGSIIVRCHNESEDCELDVNLVGS
jgi:hypothetical protein